MDDKKKKNVGNERVLTLLELAADGPIHPVDLVARKRDPEKATASGKSVFLDAHDASTVAASSGAGDVVTLEQLADKGAASRAEPDDTRTTAASRFVEGELLGRGGLGEVVEALDLDLRRRVAIKRVRPNTHQRHGVARLIAEAQITAQLDHPNIPPVYSLGIDGAGRPFFAMVRIEGISLAQLIVARVEDRAVAREFSTARMLRLFLPVAHAIAFAHSRGVLHRDIKPDNVMLGRFGEVRVVDWGLAKVMGREPTGGDAQPATTSSGTATPEESSTQGEDTVTAGSTGSRQRVPRSPDAVETTAARPASVAGHVHGTPGYMAPEQAEGRTDLDERADVYALGATLYAMLAGRPPVTARTALMILADTVQGRITPLEKIALAPPPLYAVVHKALATKREDRYASVLELIDDVEAVLDGQPIAAQRRDHWARRFARLYVGRNKRIARLRFFDIDSLAWGCMLVGAGMGAWAASVIEPWLQYVLISVGTLFMLPFAYVWFRKARPDDPGQLKPLREGLPSSGIELTIGRTEPHDDGKTATTDKATPPQL